jgi:hypothetical protein
MIGLVVAAASLAPVAWTAAPAAEAAAAPTPRATCTWGGTPAAPTGTFTISPGLTNTPLAQPAVFNVTGDLAGDPGCTGRFSYIGQVDASGTCSVNTFEGKAKGLPGVSRFAGVGVTVLGPARLYDKYGNIVGSENAQVATPANAPHIMDCSRPPGFSGGTFSSVIELFSGGAS